MGTNCVGVVAPKTPTETELIRLAILENAAFSGVNAQFILAIIIQESKGCDHVKATFTSHSNTGVMQTYQGSGTCGNVDPCPYSVISQMVQDGTMGTASSSRMMQYVNKARDPRPAQAFHKAARFYNLGPSSTSANGDLSSPERAATVRYASSIANRLTGWAS